MQPGCVRRNYRFSAFNPNCISKWGSYDGKAVIFVGWGWVGMARGEGPGAGGPKKEMLRKNSIIFYMNGIFSLDKQIFGNFLCMSSGIDQ